MPGPCPGMDPYLEAPQYWGPFHDRLVFHLGTVLQEVLPDNYVAEFRQRVELLLSNREILPDVAVLHAAEAPRPGLSPAAPAADPAVQVVARPEESMERYIEVVRIPDGQLVTVLELSSPTNKVDSRGRGAYLAKQQAILSTEVSLVEIDLLRSGPHWASVPEILAARYRPYDYLVCVSRPADRCMFECYFRTVREQLPAIAVPLGSPDPDVTLPIQTAFDRACDQARLWNRVRYSRPVSPPLGSEDQAWIEAVLRETGLVRGA